MNQWLVRHILLPLHEKLRGRQTIAYYHLLERLHASSQEQIENFRQQRFAELLHHCQKQVPYYQRVFRETGFDASSPLTQLSRLPILERETIRSNLAELTARNYQGQLIKYNTGGSTGEPLVFYTEKVKEARHNAYKMHCRHWHDIRPGDREVHFWGSPIELDKQSRARIWKDMWLLNLRLLSAFDLTEQRLHDYAVILRKFRPRLIYGYPTVTFRVAQYIKDTNFDLQGYCPTVISCTAEMLFDHQREIMREVFGCPVVNEYGSRDGGLIAHECTYGKMHIAAEHVIVEVDNPDETGVGDLLITNLDGYGMPLIRYRIGDRGRLSDATCECGLPLPMMSEIAGRTNDFVKGKEGRLIHSLAPIYILREMSNIRQFKIIQHEDLHLSIQLVERQRFTLDDEEQVRAKMAKVFAFDIPVDFEIVDVIAPEKSGKYRWVVCKA